VRYASKYEVVVTCPAAQQSAQSHAITVFKPLWAEPYTLKGEFPLHIPAWRVSGTPTDCIKVALTSNLLQEWHPDLVRKCCVEAVPL
jgi:5'-nucleotidase